MKALQTLALLCAALLAASCGNAVLGVQLNLVTKACPGALSGTTSRDPSLGVTSLHIVVSGDNLNTISLDAPFSAGSAQVPNVPIGTNRRIVIEGRNAAGNLRARADSGLFDATGSADLKLTLFLRVLDAFTLTGDTAGSTCTQMGVARAGHAMALLPDGRVLVTGGFSVSNGQLVPHNEAEIYDPSTGQFTLAPSETYPRSGHAALAVQLGSTSTGVLVLGGEGPGTNGGGGPVKPLELFDGSQWQTITPAASSPAREHQAAAVDLRTGFALFVGGQTGPDSGQAPTVLNSFSYYDPQSGAVKDSATQLPQPLTDAVAVPRNNSVNGGPAQGGVVLVGGRDGALQPSRQVSGLIWRDTVNDFQNDPNLATGAVSMLPTPRVKHAAVQLADDTILTAGGVTAESDSSDYSSPTSEIDIIDPGAQTVVQVTAQLVQARADLCAVTLEDGSVLIAGGAWQDLSGLHSANEVDLVVPQGASSTVRNLMGPSNGNWSLQQSRARASCIRLRDGSVLVTGGLSYPSGGGVPMALTSAEIYTPVGAAAP